MKRTWFAAAAWLAICTPAMAQTVSATSTPATSLVQTGQHVLFGAHTSGTISGWLLLFDAASEPADGVVSPKGCFAEGPSAGTDALVRGTVGMANTPAAVPFTTGIVAVFSIGADCFHKIASATYISMLWQ